MANRLLALALIVIQMQVAANSPLRTRRSPRELSHQPVLISTHPLQQTYYSRRGNIPLLAPIPLSQLYLQKLHVVHGTVQHLVTKDNVKIPVFTQTVPQNTGIIGNYTHPTLLPLLIPIHNIVSTSNHLIPVRDVSVIPLQRNKIEKAQFRAAEKKDEDNEPSSNQYRNFYGGYGTGLFFGGHGSGHGFYAYGK